MKRLLGIRYGVQSFLAMEAMILLTGVHHVYRLGLGQLVPALGLLIAPLLLALWYRRSGSRWPLWIYSLQVALVFFYFGVVDGFADHVLKELGLPNLTFLPGSDQEVVETVYHLWSPAAGHAFYEWTGILTFAAGVAAVYFTSKMMGKALTSRQITAPVDPPTPHKR
ncbi:hypothetical protein [Arthrobacter sp. D3-16]